MKEAPKAHELIPDSLGYTELGYLEQKDGDGQLFIYWEKDPSLYVVLGKYAEANGAGHEYYVSDWSTIVPARKGWRVHKCEHLLQAVAFIHECHERYLAGKAHSQPKDTDNADV